MGINAQPNNRNWNQKANLLAAQEAYSHPEYNDLASGKNYASPDNTAISAYEDSDLGSSLQEEKDLGNIAKASKTKKVSGALAALTITTVGAVAMINNMNNAKPSLSGASGEIATLTEREEGTYVSYDFYVTYKKRATLYISFALGEERNELTYELKWNDDPDVISLGTEKRMRFRSEESESPFLIPKSYSGQYEFRIYSQYGYGKNSLYGFKEYKR